MIRVRVRYSPESEPAAPVEFEKWATMMQDGKGGGIITIMFDNAKGW